VTTKRHDELMKLTKEQLTAHILEVEAAKPDIAEREVHIKSPAGPVHVHKGFVDDGAGPIVITGLPEDELGFWAPYYSLTINGQDLGGPEILPRDS